MSELALELLGSCAKAVEGLQPGQVGAEALEFGESQLGGDIADESVLSEGAAAVAADGHVEAPTAGAVGSGNFGSGIFWAGMQVDANFDTLID
jgi:hypothetical protein